MIFLLLPACCFFYFYFRIVTTIRKHRKVHCVLYAWFFCWRKKSVKSRDGKTYKRASNACVNFFIVLVKSVINSTLFCCKSEICCDLARFCVILMAWIWWILNFYLKKRKLFIYDIVVASIVVWQFYFAHNCCHIYFILFCCKLTFVVIYAPISGKIVLAQSLLV